MEEALVLTLEVPGVLEVQLVAGVEREVQVSLLPAYPEEVALTRLYGDLEKVDYCPES